MTVKELKDIINKIPEEYDNLSIITDDPLGSCDIDVDDIDALVYDNAYFIKFTI